MTPQISSASPISISVPADQMFQQLPSTLASNMRPLHATLDQPQAGLPHSVKGPLVWSGPKLANNKGYTFTLSAADISELENALESFMTLGLDGDKVSTSNFPLPTLGPKLVECARSLFDGMGFAVIRGLDPEKYSPEDNLMLYLGVSSYIGDKRGDQDGKGTRLVHVTDAKQWKNVPAKARHGIHQRGTLPFHTDMGAGILSLQVRECAVEGGATCVVSAWTVYNELMSCHPDDLRVLATPNWPIQISGKTHKYICRPLIQVVNDRVFACLDSGRLGPQQSGIRSVPNLTQAQVRALTTLMEVAARHQVRIRAQPGDLVYINNFAVLHARERYEDSATTSRHLIRMWLHNSSLGGDIPDSLKTPWKAAFGAKARSKHFPELYPVVPSAEYEVPRYTSGSAAFVMEDSFSEEEGDEVTAGPSASA